MLNHQTNPCNTVQKHLMPYCLPRQSFSIRLTKGTETTQIIFTSEYQFPFTSNTNSSNNEREYNAASVWQHFMQMNFSSHIINSQELIPSHELNTLECLQTLHCIAHCIQSTLIRSTELNCMDYDVNIYNVSHFMAYPYTMMCRPLLWMNYINFLKWNLLSSCFPLFNFTMIVYGGMCVDHTNSHM